MTRLREEGGFTLQEVLVTMTLMLIVLGTTLTVLSQFEQTTGINQRQNEAQDAARRTLSGLAREFRNLASPVPEQPDAVERAESNDMVFLTVAGSGLPTTSNEGNVKRVRYCLGSTAQSDGTYRLYKQEQTWGTGAPVATANMPVATECPAAPNPTSTDDWHTQRVVAEQVVNTGRPAGDQPLWQYEVRDPACSANPGDAACLEEINAIRAELFVDVNPGRRPTESRIATGVFLRNQNQRPSASFSVTPTGGGAATLNASFSDDPESGKLSYRWFLGTESAVIAAIAANTGPPECTGSPPTQPCQFSDSGPIINHTFGSGTFTVTLEVSDPADLADFAEATFTLE